MVLKAIANYSYIFISKKLATISISQLRKDLISQTSYTVEENGESKTYCLIKQTKKGNYRIPYGLLGRIQPVFNKYNIKLKIKQPPKDKPDYINLDDGFNGCLRRYQLRAYLRGIKNERGILNHATGAGKTITMSSLIFSINQKTLYLVPNKTLLHSTAKEIKKFTDYEVGVLGDGYKQTDTFVVVATAQSITSLLGRNRKPTVNWLKSFKCLILDECHHSGSPTWKTIAFLCTNARYRYGCTGTVTRGDGAVILLHATTDEVIHSVSSSFLIRLGYLAKPYIYFVRYCKDPGDDYRNKIRNWKVIQNMFIMGDKDRRYAVNRIANKLKRRLSTLIVVQRVKQGQDIKDNVEGSKFLSGASSTKKRDEEKKDLKNKNLMCLIATNIFNEGVDIPSLDALIKAGGGKSEISNTQILGRALRVSKHKKKALVIDFADYKNQTTFNHSLVRWRIYKKEPEFVVRSISLKKFLKTKIKKLLA